MGINIMVEKNKGNDMVNKLRDTLLYDTDFNHNNTILWRKMMWIAEHAAVIAPEQYGSRKIRRTIDHALDKRIVIDIAR